MGQEPEEDTTLGDLKRQNSKDGILAAASERMLRFIWQCLRPYHSCQAFLEGSKASASCRPTSELADPRQLLGLPRPRTPAITGPYPCAGLPQFRPPTSLAFYFLGGFYMLLDPKNAKPRQKSVLLSPLSHSSGCLSLSFHYILRGQSPGAALTIHASVLGETQSVALQGPEAHLPGLG